VDLYFLLKYHFKFKQVSDRARELFGPLFNVKLFKEQLSYFEDIDYSEKVEFAGKSVSADVIKDFLTKTAVEAF
jgi:hypothetical protein